MLKSALLAAAASLVAAVYGPAALATRSPDAARARPLLASTGFDLAKTVERLDRDRWPAPRSAVEAEWQLARRRGDAARIGRTAAELCTRGESSGRPCEDAERFGGSASRLPIKLL